MRTSNTNTLELCLRVVPFCLVRPPLFFLKHTYIDYSVTLYSMPWIQSPQTTRPHRCVAQSSVEP